MLPHAIRVIPLWPRVQRRQIPPPKPFFPFTPTPLRTSPSTASLRAFTRVQSIERYSVLLAFDQRSSLPCSFLFSPLLSGLWLITTHLCSYSRPGNRQARLARSYNLFRLSPQHCSRVLSFLFTTMSSPFSSLRRRGMPFFFFPVSSS